MLIKHFGYLYKSKIYSIESDTVKDLSNLTEFTKSYNTVFLVYYMQLCKICSDSGQLTPNHLVVEFCIVDYHNIRGRGGEYKSYKMVDE